MHITFNALNYAVETPDGNKTILNSIEGCLQPSKLTALMGPSG